jgi:hypothetical protein
MTRRAGHRFDMRVRGIRIAWLGVATAAAVVLVDPGGVDASAGFRGDASAATSVATLTMASPASASAGSVDGCSTVDVVWSSAAGVDSYRVEVRTGLGPWGFLGTTTGAATTIRDSIARTGTTVTYRVISTDAGNTWEGATPAQTPPLSC